MADTAMTDAPAVAGTGAVVTSAKKKAAEFEVLEARVSELLAQAAASPAQLTEVVEALLSLEKTQRLARAPPRRRPRDLTRCAFAGRRRGGHQADGGFDRARVLRRKGVAAAQRKRAAAVQAAQPVEAGAAARHGLSPPPLLSALHRPSPRWSRSA